MLRSAKVTGGAVLAQIAQRDEQSLGALYDRYGALVYTLAMRITGERLAAEAVVLAVFQSLWHAAASFASDEAVGRWLIVRTRQQALTMVRPGYVDTAAGLIALSEVCAAGGKAGAQTSVDTQTVRAGLHALPTDQRDVIERAYYGGFTCVAIAAELGQPLAAVTAALGQGLLMLHERLLSGAENAG